MLNEARMRAASSAVLAVVILTAGPAAASAQLGSAAETRSSDVVQELALQEEIYPQRPGWMQWVVQAGVHDTDDEAVAESTIGLELGLVDGVEVQGSVPVEVGLDSGAAGLGQSTLALLWAPLREEGAGVSLFLANSFPARSGVGSAVFEHDAWAIGHYALGRVHAQIGGGVEVQHGRALREARQRDVRVDPQASLALWLHLDTVAIALEGAAEPEEERFAWQLGPTLLWNAVEHVVLIGHANASLGGERPRYEGAVAAVVQTELFR